MSAETADARVPVTFSVAEDDDIGGIRAILAAIFDSLMRDCHPDNEVGLVGPDDDLFAAGATSLEGVMLLARAYQELGVDVTFQALLEEPTIRGLSKRCITRLLADSSSG